YKIHHDQEPALREQMKKVRAAREDLHKLAIAERYDEGQVRRAADTQAKAMSDLAVMHIQTMRRMRDVLTPEQRAKFDQLHERRPGPGPRPGQK
ncbi:MAG TPA: Spy/CpxP family protein refolding chaperone, partial [Burkholderiales bacterium]